MQKWVQMRDEVGGGLEIFKKVRNVLGWDIEGASGREKKKKLKQRKHEVWE